MTPNTENIFDSMRRNLLDPTRPNGVYYPHRQGRHMTWRPCCGEPGPVPIDEAEPWKPCEVQINGWRVRGYRRAIRDTACSRCSLLRRWMGFRWCGKPYPLQLKRGAEDGCGCFLWLKSRMKKERCDYGRWSI